MSHPAQQVALQEYIDTVDSNAKRVDRLTAQIRDLSEQSRLSPLIKALQAMRGISLIVAATVAAELGNLRRFANPAQMMAYLGLVPSEHSTGEKTKRGSITKTGNGHVLKALIESTGLSAAGQEKPGYSQTSGKSQYGGLSDCLEGPVATLWTLLAISRQRKKSECR